MPYDSLEELINSHEEVFSWIKIFIQDINLEEKSDSFATITLKTMGDNKLSYIAMFNSNLKIKLEMVETLYAEISAIICTLESMLEVNSNVTIDELLENMLQYENNKIALATGSMTSVSLEEMAVYFLPQMIETRESFLIAIDVLHGIEVISAVSENIFVGRENEKLLKEAKNCAKYISEIKNLRTKLMQNREAAEKNNQNIAEEENENLDNNEDRKLTVKEFEEMQNEASNSTSSTSPPEINIQESEVESMVYFDFTEDFDFLI